MEKLKNRVSESRFVYGSSILSFLILSAVVFLFPIEFSAYRNSDITAPVWYCLSLTGGVYGGGVIILLLLVFLLMHFKKQSGKITKVYFFISVILFVEVLISVSTLYFLKDLFKNPRPAQSYFIEKGLIESTSEYFSMTPEEKRIYLQRKLNEDKSKAEEVYPPILDSWINETVYSFPSGHAQTAFFLGTILAFVINGTGSKRLYALIPLLWAMLVAVSRVVIGIHYPADVAAGAFIGLVLGLIVISFRKINSIFE